MSEPVTPVPPKSQLSNAEQREIIRAALETLDPRIFWYRPSRAEGSTLADHFERAIVEAIGSAGSNNIGAVPNLLCDMAAAAAGKLEEIARRLDTKKGSTRRR